MYGPVRRVGGANWASFSGIWWVVVLTTWVGGGAGPDAGLAAQETPVERGTQLSTRLLLFLVVFGGEIGRGAGVPVSTLEGRRWSEPPCWVEQRVWPGQWPAQS